MKKQPDTKVLTFTIAPDQGMAAIAVALDPPKGYVFQEMIRKGTKAKIIYRKKAKC